jgi:hypothetical protein
LATGEKPYLIKHGTDRDAYFLIAVPVTEDEGLEWAKDLGRSPTVITMGRLKLLPLQVEREAAIGTIEQRLYDPTASGWTATVAVMRFK